MSLKNLSAATKIHKLVKQNLKNKKINLIYKKFEKSLNFNSNFVVAVSGGPDSLALSFLAKVYSIKNNINPKFIIIDHKLRTKSTDEAKKVKKVLSQLSINAQILTWKGRKPTKNIQALAREKRYEFLIKICQKYKIKNILLGHHRDDLYENFFIRLLRGSGLNGLVSFDKINKLSNINLLRPLLNHKKVDLEFLSKYVFSFYINDPSNQDEKYLRIKIRKLISGLQSSGLDKSKFLNTLNNLKLSKYAIDFYTNENIKKNAFYSKIKNKIILNKEFFRQPEEIVFRSFTETLKLIGKGYYPVRGKKLVNLINRLEKNTLSKATLGGCIIEKVNETVIISKEH